MLLLYRSPSVSNFVGAAKLFYAGDFVENNVDYWHRQVGSFFPHTKQIFVKKINVLVSRVYAQTFLLRFCGACR